MIAQVTPHDFSPYETYLVVRDAMWWGQVLIVMVSFHLALKLVEVVSVGMVLRRNLVLMSEVRTILDLVKMHGQVTESVSARTVNTISDLKLTTEVKAEDMQRQIEALDAKLDATQNGLTDTRRMLNVIARGFGKMFDSQVVKRPRPADDTGRAEPPTPDPETPEREVPK
jgi:LytS/YehU family sensor histidine kinase